jgi:hypothetical protein
VRLADARGRRATPVALPWQRRADGDFGFTLESATPDAVVVIDPVLEYASFVGGSNADEARDVFVDERGAVYVTAGRARWTSRAPGTPPATRGKECVVFKLAPDGKRLEFATYLAAAATTWAPRSR